jgi:serine protease Do
LIDIDARGDVYDMLASECSSKGGETVSPKTVHTMTTLHFIKSSVVCLLLAATAQAQSTVPRHSASGAVVRPGEPASSNILRELDSSIESVVNKVSPAVVQIVVAGYGPAESHGNTETATIVRQHAVGAGIIVDPDGYIITNAHVVEGGQRIRVILPPPPADSSLDVQPIHAGQILEAKVLGLHRQSDLALLKVEATNLPSVHLRDEVRVRQGEVVLAIGSPEGLRNSVTMGVVSSVARQPDSDNPMVYIQTDAALNPGNSGGPLVDVDGNVVGINTLIISKGGGSEGLGFAIPAEIVDFDYQHLRKYGRVQRVAIGAKAQTITPTLAAGLGLAKSWGAIISNVNRDGPAQAAGLRTEDIVVAVDDRPIIALPDFIAALYLHPVDKELKIDIHRGTTPMSFKVPVTVYHDSMDELSDVPDLQKNLVWQLSVFVTDLDDRIKALLHQDGSDSGIVVIAQAGGPRNVDTGLQPGDVILAILHTPLHSVSQLQATLNTFKSGDPVVLQIERDGKLQYLAFEME